MISVIIPTYNGAKFLEKYSLPSLLKQNYQNWEALVVNDGSKDNTETIVKNFINKDNRIKLFTQEKNQGLAAALNLGVKESKGDYIFILEHDDIWLENKLSKYIKVLEGGVKICTSKAIVYNTIQEKFKKMNNGNLSCLAIKREVSNFLFPIPEEDKKYLGIEDGVITARLKIAEAKKLITSKEIYHISEVLTIMNSNEKTLSGERNSKKMANRYYFTIKLFSNLRKDYPELKSLLFFWKKHYYYNVVLNYLPNNIKDLIYKIVDKLKEIKNKKELKIFKEKKKEEYQKIKIYRNFFD